MQSRGFASPGHPGFAVSRRRARGRGRRRRRLGAVGKRLPDRAQALGSSLGVRGDPRNGGMVPDVAETGPCQRSQDRSAPVPTAHDRPVTAGTGRFRRGREHPDRTTSEQQEDGTESSAAETLGTEPVEEPARRAGSRRAGPIGRGRAAPRALRRAFTSRATPREVQSRVDSNTRRKSASAPDVPVTISRSPRVAIRISASGRDIVSWLGSALQRPGDVQLLALGGELVPGPGMERLRALRGTRPRRGARDGRGRRSPAPS